MLCNSCQRLDLDQICGLAPSGGGLGGPNGYALRSEAEVISLYHEGYEEIKLSCDLCQVIFRIENGLTALYPHALLSSAEPGVLPVSSVKDTADERYRAEKKLFDVFCSQGTSSPRRLDISNEQYR
jgi:hypothetical protein